jgi:hypothetical protein
MDLCGIFCSFLWGVYTMGKTKLALWSVILVLISSFISFFIFSRTALAMNPNSILYHCDSATGGCAYRAGQYACFDCAFAQSYGADLTLTPAPGNCTLHYVSHTYSDGCEDCTTKDMNN